MIGSLALSMGNKHVVQGGMMEPLVGYIGNIWANNCGSNDGGERDKEFNPLRQSILEVS